MRFMLFRWLSWKRECKLCSREYRVFFLGDIERYNLNGFCSEACAEANRIINDQIFQKLVSFKVRKYQKRMSSNEKRKKTV